MPRYIREGRMGPPKSFKTGAVVGSYPRPLLCFQFDEGGAEVVQTPLNIIEPTMEKFNALLATPADQLPPISIVNLAAVSKKSMTMDYAARANSVPLQTFITMVNALVNKCPFKTVVVDPVTGLSDFVMQHLAAANAAALADPRKWAPMVGGKVQQCIGVVCSLPAHTVFLMHSMLEKNEVSGQVIELPMISSRFREIVGADLSQFFYATKEAGKPVIYTSDRGMVRGLGARWPQNLPNPCGPLFNDIYGKENL